MNRECNIIRDLLPLYAEEMVSEESRALVENHLRECESCRKELQEIKESQRIPPDTDLLPFRRVRRKLRIGRARIGILTALITLLVITLAVVYLNAPNYLPYSEESLSFRKDGTGRVTAVFGEEVTGYEINRSPDPDSGEMVYSMITWNSLWDQYILRRNVKEAVLNPDRSDVNSVYYYSADDLADRLIYGRDLDPGGGIHTLPRLYLASYLWFAIVLSAVLGILLVLVRKREKARRILGRVVLVPVSYVVAHLLAKGFPASSYHALRDFIGILLTMIPVYGILLLVVNLLENRSKAATRSR